MPHCGFAKPALHPRRSSREIEAKNVKVSGLEKHSTVGLQVREYVHEEAVTFQAQSELADE